MNLTVLVRDKEIAVFFSPKQPLQLEGWTTVINVEKPVNAPNCLNQLRREAIAMAKHMGRQELVTAIKNVSYR